MAVSDADIAQALDLFSDLGPLTTRKMMGGLCLYRNGTIFALLRSDGTLFLKARGPLAEALEAEGAVQFGAGDPRGLMPYWTLPEDALDEPERACDWARRALAEL